MTTIESPAPTIQRGQVLLEAKTRKKYFPVTKGRLISRITGYIKAGDELSFE